ncbi:MAG: serine/threonine-protein phosphatase [Clostridiales bacterium]|nr:serine/threonine-protein phosphatase [Clostridiales bacterium]
MIDHRDNYSLYDENEIMEIAAISVIGNRNDQQDSFGYELKENEGIVVLCDGMGGHEGGKLASTTAIEHILNEYNDAYPCEDPHALLVDLAHESDTEIRALKTSEGEPMKAGSTIVSVFVRKNILYWLSVGDSRVYILRGDELVKITEDHTYKYMLDEQMRNGRISEMEYNERVTNGEALVSFLGRGELPYIDANDFPFELESGDKLLLMSDGLYKLVSDESIRAVLLSFSNIRDTVSALETMAQTNGRYTNRDNTTIAMVRIK